MTTADYAAECEALAKELRLYADDAEDCVDNDDDPTGERLREAASALSRVPRLVAALRIAVEHLVPGTRWHDEIRTALEALDE